MYAIIRRYKSASVNDIVRYVQKDFLPIISNAPGFVTYYVVDEGAGVLSSISVFEDQDSAEYSNKLAAAWVREHPTSLPEPPEIAAGEVLVHKPA
jgi:hypothetical protein